MTDPVLEKFLEKLVAAFPATPIQDKTTAVYVDYLADIPDGLAEPLADLIITQHPKFLPSVAEIRSYLASLVVDLPTPDEAWAMVVAGQPVPKPVSEARTEIGGQWEIDNGVLARTRPAFIQAYRAKLEKIQRTVQTEGLPGLRRLGYRSKGELSGVPEALEAKPAIAAEVIEMTPQKRTENLERLGGLLGEIGQGAV